MRRKISALVLLSLLLVMYDGVYTSRMYQQNTKNILGRRIREIDVEFQILAWRLHVSAKQLNVTIVERFSRTVYVAGNVTLRQLMSFYVPLSLSFNEIDGNLKIKGNLTVKLSGKKAVIQFKPLNITLPPFLPSLIADALKREWVYEVEVVYGEKLYGEKWFMIAGIPIRGWGEITLG